jgi:hypothetical protein
MTSLVEELQRDALDSSVSVLDLLRKALVVATKLNIDEFKEWIELELKGYSGQETVPDYRNVVGEIKAYHPYNLFYGWIPCILPDDINQMVSKNALFQSISELQNLVEKSENFLYVSTPFQDILRELFDSETNYSLKISTSQMSRILEHTKDIILKWSLQLEEDGILGDGMTFNKQEKSIASHKDYTYIIYANGDINMNEKRSINLQSKGNVEFNGVLASGDIAGDINQNIQNLQISQSQEFIQLIEKLKILKELFETDTELSNDDKEMALGQIAVLENEAKNPDKQSSLQPVKFATTFLKGVVSALPPTTILFKNVNELIPTITELFQHIHL